MAHKQNIEKRSQKSFGRLLSPWVSLSGAHLQLGLEKIRGEWGGTKWNAQNFIVTQKDAKTNSGKSQGLGWKGTKLHTCRVGQLPPCH